ncbi:MAG: DNA recombination protein RmuC [Flavobacteriales bacterium]
MFSLELIIGICIGALLTFIFMKLYFNGEILKWKQATEIEKINAETQANRSKLIEEELATLRLKHQQEFELLASKILEEKSAKVLSTNKEAMDAIINPLKEKITLFEQKIDRNFIEETKNRSSLLTEIQRLNTLNTRLGDEANQLSAALKGNNKTQGDWGEMLLETILEKSGLTNGVDYLTQSSFSNDEGKRSRPDVIVNLPDNKHIIVDSKVSISNYVDFTNATEKSERQEAIAKHISSIKAHIKSLSEKNYQSIKGLDTPEFVLLFIPIESAFSEAMSQDPQLYNYAWERKIVMVTPTTLLATLRTIASIWQQEKRMKNAEEIANEAGKLYDKFVSFVQDIIDISKRLNQAQDATNDAINKLQNGNGNLISKAEKMRELGAKNSKNLPGSFLSLFVLFAIVLMSCGGSKQTKSSAESVYYNDDLSLFYPQMGVYHHSNDSSSLIFSISTKDLLYSRPKGQGPFQSKVEVNFKVKEVGNNAIIDSSTLVFHDVLNYFPKSEFQREFKFKFPESKGTIEVTIKDLLRGFSSYRIIDIDKSTTIGHQDFKVYNVHAQLIVLNDNWALGDSLVVVSERNSNKKIDILIQPDEAKLPPAPFSGSSPEFPLLKDFTNVGHLYSGDTLLVSTAGIYNLTFNSNTDAGKMSFTSFQKFPVVRDMNQLYPPLRYLTTKAEFEMISKGSYPKEKVDNFWLECGGDKERARELIESYYERVEEANKYFSSYTEGWRTDRGMIHLIFGHPTKINAQTNSETWIYGDEDSSSSLRFVFKKTKSPWFDNIYVLQRDPMFKAYWERMVSAWRSGRVYTY